MFMTVIYLYYRLTIYTEEQDKSGERQKINTLANSFGISLYLSC